MLSFLQIPEVVGFIFGLVIGASFGLVGGVCLTLATMALVH
jgi:hypothetical protein